jgi:uncharacterized phage-associated protein
MYVKYRSRSVVPFRQEGKVPMAGGREYDGAKLKELVLLLSERSASDEGFGMVKLNKLLYRADFEAFRLLGQSITGETYEKQEYGPVARSLPRALDELAGRHYVRWEHPQRGEYIRDVPAAKEKADETLFSSDELVVIDAALRELAPHGAKSVSEWSHETSVGWRTKKIGEEIPYSSAMLSIRPLTQAAERALVARFS